MIKDIVRFQILQGPKMAMGFIKKERNWDLYIL